MAAAGGRRQKKKARIHVVVCEGWILNLMSHSDSHLEHDPNLYALSIHFDGGARPNPGRGGCGFIIRRRIVGSVEIEDGRKTTCPVRIFNGSADASWSDDDTVEWFEDKETLADSDCTNNVAEYMSLILALFHTLRIFGVRCSCCQRYLHRYASIDIYGDSKLVIQQMAGQFAIRSENMQTLHHFATGLLKELSNEGSNCEACTATVQFHHVLRESNTEADALACQAITNPESHELFDWGTWLRIIHDETCTSYARTSAKADAAASARPLGKQRGRRRRNHQ